MSAVTEANEARTVSGGLQIPNTVIGNGMRFEERKEKIAARNV